MRDGCEIERGAFFLLPLPLTSCRLGRSRTLAHTSLDRASRVLATAQIHW
jgi:hypothetical protein